MENAIEIFDRLFLGSYESAKDLQFIQKNNINVIVNCTKNLNFLFGSTCAELQNVAITYFSLIYCN